MGEALRTVAILGVLFATGAPLACCLPRARPEASRFAFEALAIGLTAQVAIGLIALRTGHFSRPWIVVMTLVVMGAGIAWAWRRGGDPRPKLEPILGIGVLTIVVVALALRRHPVYFIFETGDMGEYVNSANRVANGARLIESFPNGFTVFLASTKLLLGQSHTVSGLPALGITFLLGVVASVRSLGARVAAALAIGFVLAVHPVTVWFSTFPVSETLYATLVIAAVHFFLQGRREQSNAYMIGAAVMFGLLFVVRGNALLLVPIIVVVFAVSAVADRPDDFRIQRTFTTAALAALGVAYAYDVRYTGFYFTKQLRRLVPGAVFRSARDLHLLEANGALALAFVVGLVAVVAGGWVLHRFVARRIATVAPRVLSFALVAAVVAFAVVLMVIHRDGLVDALSRWGVVLVVPALAGIALVVWKPTRYLDHVGALFLVLMLATFTVLFAHRLPAAKSAPYYLYWDRYLFSEVLPLAVLFVAIGFDGVLDLLAARTARVRVAGGVAAAALVVATIPVTRESLRVTRYTLFGDSYGALARLNALTKSAGPGTIVYSGTPSTGADWYFPSTARMFALPLQESFHRIIAGQSYNGRVAEPVYDPEGALAKLGQRHLRHGYLVAWRRPEDAPYPDSATTRYLGTIEDRFALIRRNTDRSKEKFQFVEPRLDVYALSSPEIAPSDK
jgi:4-amino-4-deoxy-L-arabinose transferase-like glycosyltransferase